MKIEKGEKESMSREKKKKESGRLGEGKRKKRTTGEVGSGSLPAILT